METNGSNPAILAACQREVLAHKVILNLAGPAGIYANMDIPQQEVEETLRLLPEFPDYLIKTAVGPVLRGKDQVALLSPEEVGQAAAWVVETTGERKHPYLLSAFEPSRTGDERLKGQEPLPANALLKYRTAARRHLVLAEIEK